MIAFDQVTKWYEANGARRFVLRDANFAFPDGDNYGILGANGAGKSSLLRVISGAEPPNRGRISRSVRVSFPIGFTGTFHGKMSGRHNVVFVSRLYGADSRKVIDFVRDFTELGPYFEMPFETYSSGMAAKLAFALSLAIDFDLYLVDEVTEVGDERFRRKCAAMFSERARTSDMIMVSHNYSTIRMYCNKAAILSDGVLDLYNDVERAIEVHTNLQRSAHA